MGKQTKLHNTTTHRIKTNPTPFSDTYLSIYLSTYLSIYLSIHIDVYLSIYLSIGIFYQSCICNILLLIKSFICCCPIYQFCISNQKDKEPELVNSAINFSDESFCRSCFVFYNVRSLYFMYPLSVTPSPTHPSCLLICMLVRPAML